MILGRLETVRLALWVCTSILAGLSMYFMFQSGCAGDLKTASLGDYDSALELDRTGGFLLWAAIGLGTVAVAIGKADGTMQRLAFSLFFLALSLVVLTIAALQFSTWGVQSCF